MSYFVACGHPATAQAAAEALEGGGNAFDAAVAALFAACAAEPLLTSLAGGGIAVYRTSEGGTGCIDFMAGMPSAWGSVEPIPTQVDFGDTTQQFFLGYGSVATPGVLAGLLHICRRYGRLNPSQVLGPARRLAEGHRLSAFQAGLIQLLAPFCLHSTATRALFAPRGRLLQRGDVIRNRALAAFFSRLSEDPAGGLREYQSALLETLHLHPGSLTPQDVLAYRVREQPALRIRYRDARLTLPSSPSLGGVLVAHALGDLSTWNPVGLRHNSAGHLQRLCIASQQWERLRTEELFSRVLDEPQFWGTLPLVEDRLGGTTHVSIIDREGNAVALTASNGQSAGVMIPGTGVLLNNICSEPDLMQHRRVYRAGGRIPTMMTPAIISRGGRIEAVLGTGGSNRIRSAVLQVISNLVDFGMSPRGAVDAPRIHFERGRVELERGIDPAVAARLERSFPVHLWRKKSLFFGGVHLATPKGAVGDRRRGGGVAQTTTSDG